MSVSFGTLCATMGGLCLSPFTGSGMKGCSTNGELLILSFSNYLLSTCALYDYFMLSTDTLYALLFTLNNLERRYYIYFIDKDTRIQRG